MSRARTNKENRPKRPSTLGLLLGGTGGRKDASKGAEAERQRRRRERDRSREMAAYVGYDAMYRDGIAQVMPGMFSQTVEFSDISYQSARKETQEQIFTTLSSLFNYFPADSHVQLQVVNAPIPADEVGRKVFFEPGERATAGLAEEYNRILNDKMREGVSNLVRHRYLTYAVGADDVDAAVPKLARIRGDVEQTLARIRCSSRALDGVERLELLQGQLRPGSRFEFSWDKLSPTSGARTKDFVMPSTLDFKPEGRSDCFCSDGRYGAVLAALNKVGHRGDLPRLHHRPAAAAQRDAARAAHRAERGARAREAPDRLDGQGDHRRADERHEEGLRLYDPASGAALLQGGGGRAPRLPSQQERAPLHLHRPHLHLRRYC